MGRVIVMKTIVQYFLILISLIVASYLMGIATAKDKSEVVYLTFDDDKPKDLSPNKTPIANFNKPRKVVKGVVGKAWLFDDNIAVLIDHQGFNDAFQESTFSVWLKEPDKEGILYEEGGGTNGYAVTLVGGKVEFAGTEVIRQPSKQIIHLMVSGILSSLYSIKVRCSFISTECSKKSSPRLPELVVTGTRWVSVKSMVVPLEALPPSSRASWTNFVLPEGHAPKKRFRK